MQLINSFYERLKSTPDKIIFIDNTKVRNYSISYVENASSKIYSYLINKGITKEDVICIRLPKSGRIPIAILGIIKAGVAFTVIGENASKKIRNYVLQTTKPKLILNLSLYNKILSTEKPLRGNVEPSDHDLAFIVYSSGSTGIFKGCMHEYGKLNLLVSRLKNIYKASNQHVENNQTDEIGMNQGFYGASGIYYTLSTFYSSETLNIIPTKYCKNKKLLNKYLLLNKTNEICIAPSLVDKKTLNYNKELKNLIISYEPYDNILSEANYNLLNLYGLTESLLSLTYFIVNKSYDITPVGKPFSDVNIEIRDENGKKENGEIGEICFKSEFFRGYKNMPELTSKTLIDGWFYTGDMGKFLPDGNLIILGRKTDILKVKEGYIIPYKIIAKAKQKLNLSFSYVKIFERENDKPIICLYYSDKIKLDINNVRKELKDCLLDYELPTHCKKIKKVPFLESGKIDRKAFRSPVK